MHNASVVVQGADAGVEKALCEVHAVAGTEEAGVHSLQAGVVLEGVAAEAEMASRLRAMKHEIDSINASVHQLRNTTGAVQAQRMTARMDDIAEPSAVSPEGRNVIG